MAKKSNAQLKRLQRRAEARGDTYSSNIETCRTTSTSCSKVEDEAHETSEPGGRVAKPKNQARCNDHEHPSEPGVAEKVGALRSEELARLPIDRVKRVKAAKLLKSTLEEIDQDETLKAKDRRSAKRKADAVALEETGMTSQELLNWLEREDSLRPSVSNIQSKNKHHPYIAFFGQLSFQTSKERLFAYLQKNLGSSVTSDNLKIRLLTTNGKSRGMAFVETSSPELLYACLALHHTYLDDRRINVERSVGGSNPAKRQSKLEKIRQEQQDHLNKVVEEIFKQHNLQVGEGLLDESVLQLCQKHAASVVQSAVDRFIETNGLEKDNPSAYLTYLVSKYGQEGGVADAETRPPMAKKRFISRN